MKKMGCLFIFILFLFSTAEAQEVKTPVHLRVASQDLGSAWYVYGAAFAKLWRGVLPKGSTIDILPYGGAPANGLLLDKGDAELAFSFTAIANWGVQGKVAYTKKIEPLTGFVGALDKYYLAAIATKRSGIVSLEEIAKKKLPARFVSQPMGSSGEFSMRLLFEAHGLSYEALRSWGGSITPTSTSMAQAQMTDGKADLWINVITAGHPAISELAISTELVFLPMSEEIIGKMEPYGYQRTKLPAKTFKGQDQEVPLVGWPTILVAHKDLKPELAYLFTKSLVENKDKLVKTHAGFRDFRPEDAWKMDVPLHPGAARYYREKGMIK
jgi:hypothetical protein